MANLWYWFVLLGIGSYFIGNINFSILLSRRKQDIRTLDSGNPGTMNMLRNYGAGFGALTLCLDIIKGVVPSLIGYLIFRNFSIEGYNLGYFGLYLAGNCVILGHIYPITMKFKGGKGVASTFGVFFVAEPLVMGIALVTCITIILVIEYGSVGSLFSLLIPSVTSAITLNSTYFIDGVLTVPLGLYLTTLIFIFSCVFLVYFAHRKNIVRVMAGSEHKTRLRGIFRKMFVKKPKETNKAG